MSSIVKTLLLWGMVGLFMAVLFNMFAVPTQAPEEEVIFSEFMAKLEQSALDKVTIRGQYISGVLKDHTRIRTYAADDPEMVKVLREKGVQIEVKPSGETPWYLTLLYSWGPFILFLVLVLFFMRRMQAGENSPLSFGKSRV